MPRFCRYHCGRAAFTIVELLVVVGIIAILISLIFPVVKGARSQARAVQCQSNERALWQGILAFATDNENTMPGNFFDDADSNPAHRDWLLGPYGSSKGQADYTKGPQNGTLFKYINGNFDVYRCPSRTNVAPNAGQTNATDDSSNGRFDYAIYLVFAGAPMRMLPGRATFLATGSTTPIVTACPVVCEEAPQGLNGGANDEGGHANTDEMAHTHKGGSYYIAPDGSANFFIEPPVVACANNWSAIGPSGKTANLGNSVCTWGYWSHQ
ncbi:MAG: prepilin-type N-terminal cleavage/methylation domain [Phycisphaerales bacterium]|jgi:type II secretory pathway pseudopilin PulG|nr:prepilin-type N-terminal cleavage/methylation domain [Phycisphaerales bacterium]